MPDGQKPRLSRVDMSIQAITGTPKTNVGASLLANAVSQPTLMATDSPSSRAGSLPQGYCVLPIT
ncbi:hypothetical protein EMIT0P260_20376 [Pseudomonas sp. IT-P260]